MTLDQRLERLERAAPADAPLIVITHVRAEDDTPIWACIVTHGRAPTADAIAARARLMAKGYAVAEGWGAR